MVQESLFFIRQDYSSRCAPLFLKTHCRSRRLGKMPVARRFSVRFFLLAAAFLVGVSPVSWVRAEEKPIRLLIVGQKPDGHPPTTHEFMAGAQVLATLLKPYPQIQTTVVDATDPWPEGPGLIDGSDAIAMLVSEGARWMQIDLQRHAALRRLAARGGAICALHWSVGAKEAKYIQGQLELLGGTRGGEQRKYQKLDVTLHRPTPSHPIMNGLADFKAYDEFYYSLDKVPGIVPLLTAQIDGQDETVAWAWERKDGGRSYAFSALHYHSNWQLPEYRRFILQGVLWSLKQPIPAEGVKVDIAPAALELNGVLPPPAAPDPPKKKKTKSAS